MQNERRGEKMGWIGGWLGSYLWVLVLAVLFLFQGKGREGIVGLILAGLGVFYIFTCAPWRHPVTPYWRLMIRLYVVLLTAAAVFDFRRRLTRSQFIRGVALGVALMAFPILFQALRLLFRIG